jgi:hypothetical protein
MTTAGLAAWLREFRRAVARDVRQSLIDSADSDYFITVELGGATPRVRRERYPFALYLLAARFLEDPARVGADPDERDAVLHRLAYAMNLERRDVARDVGLMTQILRSHHQRWERSRVLTGTAGVL